MTHTNPTFTRRNMLQAACASALTAGLPTLAGAEPATPENNFARFRPLHEFAMGAAPQLGGAQPISGPVQMSDGRLYGTTPYGGPLGFGTVYAMSLDGVVRTLHSFAGTLGGFGEDISAQPGAPLAQGADGSLYGTIFGGGLGQNGNTVGHGTIYKFGLGGAFTTLFQFGEGGASGTNPVAGLILASDGNFYGVTAEGGSRGNGTVFCMTPDGVVTDRHVFTRTATDGGRISDRVMQASDGNLYGVTGFGGTSDKGVVFRLGLDGSYALMHSFQGGALGGEPSSPLVQGADGALYGTTFTFGELGRGSVYRITLAGAYSVLYSFGAGYPKVGRLPQGGLTAGTDGQLYGVTTAGALDGRGAIYRIDLAGRVQLLHAFEPSPQIPYPSGLNLASNGRLYGATERGGSKGQGSLYSVASRGG